jgi:MoaA/NifB/PqqE/SkfB family radical SAM enzyme
MINDKLPKLDFNVINKCMLDCLHCCFKSGLLDRMGQLDLPKIEETLCLFKGLGGERIDLTGGEPLLRPDIEQIIFYAVQRLDLKTELVTNALLLDINKMKACQEAGIKQVAISLDGSKPKIHAQIRGTDSAQFRTVLTHIQNCAMSDLFVKLNTVVFKSNLDDLVNITKLAIELGVKEHGFYFFSPIGRGSTASDNVADPLVWLRVIREELGQFADRIKIQIETPILETEVAAKLKVSCFLERPWHLQILPDSNVYPCAIMSAYHRPIANLRQKTLTEIWQGEEEWKDNYYKEQIAPLLEKYGSCVDYPKFAYLLKSERYRFVCLCRKFDLKEVLL